jgi:hypothetical protein
VRPLAVVVLFGLPLGAPGAGTADSCTCDGRALCINGDARRGKFSVCINRTPLGRVLQELSGLSGQPLRVTSGMRRH